MKELQDILERAKSGAFVGDYHEWSLYRSTWAGWVEYIILRMTEGRYEFSTAATLEEAIAWITDANSRVVTPAQAPVPEPALDETQHPAIEPPDEPNTENKMRTRTRIKRLK